MIKKWFGWFDIYYAEMLLGVTFAISNACIGSWNVVLVWIAFTFSWGIFKLIISVKNRRHKALIKSSIGSPFFGVYPPLTHIVFTDSFFVFILC